MAQTHDPRRVRFDPGHGAEHPHNDTLKWKGCQDISQGLA